MDGLALGGLYVLFALLVFGLFAAREHGIEPLFDLDREISIERPEAERPSAAAREIVPGRVVEVEIEANGNWEVGIEVAGVGMDDSYYDVELDPNLNFVRFDD